MPPCTVLPTMPQSTQILPDALSNAGINHKRHRLSEDERLRRWELALSIPSPRNTQASALLSPETRASFAVALDAYFALRVPLVLEALQKQAQRGSVPAIRLYLELFYQPFRDWTLALSSRGHQPLGVDGGDQVTTRLRDLLKELKAGSARIKVKATERTVEMTEQPDSTGEKEANGGDLTNTTDTRGPQGPEPSVEQGNVQ